jgi:aldehyde:ferredoxin oxidoreductase
LVPAGASPIKNWSLIGDKAFPDYVKIAGEHITKYQLRKAGCGNCPINCGGILSVKEGPFATEGRKPEYETITAFGTMLLNSDAESIIKANDVCDLYGIDTISSGTTLAFAMECYEQGIIGRKETDGIELT